MAMRQLRVEPGASVSSRLPSHMWLDLIIKVPKEALHHDLPPSVTFSGAKTLGSRCQREIFLWGHPEG